MGFRGLVCSSSLQRLMDILGVPDALDGAVEMAQEMICGGASLTSSLMVKHSAALGGYIDTIMSVLEKFYVLGQSYVCNAGIPELLQSLSFPDTMVWAVETAFTGSATKERKKERRQKIRIFEILH